MISLNVGDKAPGFVALNEFGQSISLSNFLRGLFVVLTLLLFFRKSFIWFASRLLMELLWLLAAMESLRAASSTSLLSRLKSLDNS